MTKIIVVLNGKGGVGKTTTAFNLAAIFAGDKQESSSSNRRVLLVDADPQASASWWSDRGEKKGQGEQKFDITPATNPQLLQNLRNIEGYDLIVCDTPPHLDSDTLQTLIDLADYITLPTTLGPMDVDALITTITTKIAPRAVPYRVILTKVDPRRANEAVAVQTTLFNIGIPVFNTFIRAYIAHERAALDGVPITRYKGKLGDEAAADYLRLVNELEQLKEWN